MYTNGNRIFFEYSSSSNIQNLKNHCMAYFVYLKMMMMIIRKNNGTNKLWIAWIIMGERNGKCHHHHHHHHYRSTWLKFDSGFYLAQNIFCLLLLNVMSCHVTCWMCHRFFYILYFISVLSFSRYFSIINDWI